MSETDHGVDGPIGPVEASARAATARLLVEHASREGVLVELAISLGRAVDAATAAGHASAAAMAGRELRESLAELGTLLDASEATVDPFDALAQSMRDSMGAS